MLKAITPIIKLTEYCNYNCYFCRYANHPNYKTMELAVAKRIIKEAVDFNSSNNVPFLKIIFHGGEPLLWGLDNFYKIMDYERELINQYKINIKNSIQTNGYLIDEQWLSFFRINHFDIGISLDGPESLNGHYGNDGNLKSIEKVLSNIDLIRKNKLSYGILSVITPNHIPKVKEFYDFFINNKINNIGLCYCYNPEDNEIIDSKKLGEFLVELFDLYFYQKNNLNIREFNNAIYKILKNRNTSCTTACRKNCGAFLTFDSIGNIFFCDEYNMRKDNILGNINLIKLNDIFLSDKYIKMYHESRIILESTCNKCNIKSICGCGCARNDSKSHKINYFCQSYRMLYQHINEVLEKNKSNDTY